MAEGHEQKIDGVEDTSLPKSTTNNLFEDMSRKVEGLSLNGDSAEEIGVGDVNGQKMVEEIESFCVNCHDEVRPLE